MTPVTESMTPPPASRSARWFGALGAKLGFLGVAAGAFGAHALKGRLVPVMLDVYETAARYQIIHAIVLVVVALCLERRALASWRAAGWLFAIGIVVFSGSLYALSLMGQPMWGAVTPIGGLCLLAGWVCLAFGWWWGR